MIFFCGSIKIRYGSKIIDIGPKSKRVCFFSEMKDLRPDPSRNVIRVLIAQEPGSGCKKKDPNPALKIEMLIRICWSNCEIKRFCLSDNDPAFEIVFSN